jgi:acetolactate synthase-1/2/3 large subunit
MPRIPEHVARAFAVAASGRPGPVVLGLPEDMLLDLVDVADADPVPVPEGAVSDDELHRLTAMLRAAHRPVVLLGGNRWTETAVREVGAWVERWSLPTVAHFRCQDHIDNDSPYYVGRLGFGRDEGVARLVAAADLIVTIGAGLDDTSTDGFRLVDPAATPPLVQVTPYADSVGMAYRPTLLIQASPIAFGRAVAVGAPTTAPPWRSETIRAREAHLRCRAAAPDGDDLDVGLVFELLAKRLPPDTVVTIGAGNYSAWPQHSSPAVPRLPDLSLPAWATQRLHGLQRARRRRRGPRVPRPPGPCRGRRRLLPDERPGAGHRRGRRRSAACPRGQQQHVRHHSLHQEMHYPGRVVGTELTSVDFAGYARALGAHGEAVSRTDEFEPALTRRSSALVRR